jgi:hypothetical protein
VVARHDGDGEAAREEEQLEGDLQTSAERTVSVPTRDVACRTRAIRHEEALLARNDRPNLGDWDGFHASAEPPAGNDESDGATGAVLELHLFDDADLLSRLRIDEEAVAVREPVFGVQVSTAKIHCQLNEPRALWFGSLHVRLSARFGEETLGTGREMG